MRVLKIHCADAVDQYHRCNESKYPATLIIYRDGVGEGQIDYVKEHEIPAIKVSTAMWMEVPLKGA